jgi:hypothetical protein
MKTNEDFGRVTLRLITCLYFLTFLKFSKTRRTTCFVPLLILRYHQHITFQKGFRYIPSWISISLEIVCNAFELQFVKYDSRSFMSTAKRKGDTFPFDVHHCYIRVTCTKYHLSKLFRMLSQNQ